MLLTIFALQHSVTAGRIQEMVDDDRPGNCRAQHLRAARSPRRAVFWQWHPMPARVWQIADPQIAMAVVALSCFGWLLVLTSTFLINHFELFGLHQVANNLTGNSMPPMKFKTPMLYNVVRHPIYLGFIIFVWATPMTAGHLLFAAVVTAYIFCGIAPRSMT